MSFSWSQQLREFWYTLLYKRPWIILFYLSIAEEAIAKKFPALTSRYPTAGQGGIYPTKLYVRTTTKTEKVKLVENLLNPDVYKTIYEYPIIGETYINTFAFHSSRIAPLGADFRSVGLLYSNVYQNSLNCWDQLKLIY